MTEQDKIDAVEDIKNGIIDNFYEKTYALYQKMLLKKCLDKQLVEEVINDSFMRLREKILQFQGTTYGELNLWMQKIINTVFLNRLKNLNKWMISGKMSDKPRTLRQADVIGDVSYQNFYDWVSPEQEAGIDLQLECAEELLAVKNKLTRAEYKKILMFAQGYNARELAKKYKCSTKTIENSIYKIRKKLKN